MAIRRSAAHFLEVLEASPVLNVPIEVDVYAGADPATMLATLDGASAKRFTRELSELGAGSFRLNRHDPKATAANLAVGNLVKFRVAGFYRHAIWIEETGKSLVSTGEAGGEAWAISGRGALAYLERGAVYPPVWPPAAAAFVASSSADNGATGATSLVIPKPAGTAAGDTVVVALVCVGGGPATPAGWKRIRNTTNGTLRTQIYVRRALASEPASWSWFWSSARQATGGAVTLRNASSDDTTWAIADETGSGSSIKEPSVSVPLVDGVLLGIAAKATSTTLTPPAGMIETVDRAADGRSLEIAYEVNPALGDTGDRTATGGGTSDWIGMQIWVPSLAEPDALFPGATFGAVLKTLIDAAQARGALPHLTYDFTGEVDSHGEPWPDTHDLTFHVGTNLLEVWRHLVTLGLEGGMTPALKLQAFVDASRHFEDSVILRKGHHFTGEVVEAEHGTGLRTRYLVEGAGGRIVEVIDPVAEGNPRLGRREGYLALSTSDNPSTLQRAGEIALELDRAEDQARWVRIDHGQTPEGLYEPWVDYRESDWIGLDAEGSGGDPTAHRVVAITLEEPEGGAGSYTVDLELNSVELDAFLRLQRRMDALTRQSTAAGSGGFGGGGAGSAGRVGATATDTPGYLFDKLVTGEGLTKQLVGDVGAQQVRLLGPTIPQPGLEGGYAPLSSGLLVPTGYLGTGTPDATKFLRGDGTWAVPPSGGGGGGGSTLPLDVAPTSPSAWDDEFAASSLDPKWTNPVASGLGLDIVVANGWLRFEPSAAGTGSTGSRGGFGIRQVAPTGAFTVSAKVSNGVSDAGTDDARIGLFVGRTSATSYTRICGHQTSVPRIATKYPIASYTEAGAWAGYAGSGEVNVTQNNNDVRQGLWYRIAWDGASTLVYYYSTDGLFWRLLATDTSMGAPDRIGLVIVANTANILADHKLGCDWFRVTEP